MPTGLPHRAAAGSLGPSQGFSTRPAPLMSVGIAEKRHQLQSDVAMTGFGPIPPTHGPG